MSEIIFNPNQTDYDFSTGVREAGERRPSNNYGLITRWMMKALGTEDEMKVNKALLALAGVIFLISILVFWIFV